MGLRWVKENIAYFGGNPEKVTIFGNSYGSMAISGHLMSPMSKGLFQRAICQSGEQIMPSILSQNPLSTARTLAQKLNCTGNSTADILSCFVQMDGDTLVLSSHDMPFTFSVEPEGSLSDTILPDSPLNLLRSGQLNSVPLMIGATSGEGLPYSLPILISPELTSYFNDHWEIAAVEALILKSVPGLKDPERIANAAREFYIGSANISRAIETNLTAMMSDRTFIHPAALVADFHKKARNHIHNQTEDQIYVYYFNKQSDKSYADPVLIEYGSDKFLGAGHADELQYIFPYESFSYIPTDSPHFNFSRMLVRLWASFADSGIPSGAYNNVEWQPINTKPYGWFRLDENPQMINTLGNRMEFWDSFNSTDLYV
jgi:carboxylesterase type B